MRNNSNEEEKDIVGSVLCKQLYQTRECKFLKKLCKYARKLRVGLTRGLELTKAAMKATSGDDWEMLAPTNDGCVIRSVNSKVHK